MGEMKTTPLRMQSVYSELELGRSQLQLLVFDKDTKQAGEWKSLKVGKKKKKSKL